MVNRKLVRPNLAELKERLATTGGSRPATQPPRDSGDRGSSPAPRGRRPVPPDQTNAEAFYYLKQMNNQTPMVVVLDNDEQLRGHIEWYDRSCIKVHRPDAPNLLIFKHSIKYVYKLEEEDAEAAAEYSAE